MVPLILIAQFQRGLLAHGKFRQQLNFIFQKESYVPGFQMQIGTSNRALPKSYQNHCPLLPSSWRCKIVIKYWEASRSRIPLSGTTNNIAANETSVVWQLLKCDHLSVGVMEGEELMVSGESLKFIEHHAISITENGRCCPPRCGARALHCHRYELRHHPGLLLRVRVVCRGLANMTSRDFV